ncbi:MAG: peptidoglycan D,D-transpeptidase FtsI family protein [Patescibacteria group bacterium]
MVQQARPENSSSWRGGLLMITIQLLFLAVLSRLFYWQVIKGSSLRAASDNQSQRTIKLTGARGNILTNDGHLLVGNQEFYELYFEPKNSQHTTDDLINTLTPLLLEDKPEYALASSASQLKEIESDLKITLHQRMSKPGVWLLLQNKISPATKAKIEQLNLEGLHFQEYLTRYYPEASMAAHLTGFVGKDNQGQEIGYFGIEGALNTELAGQEKKKTIKTDALGFLLVNESDLSVEATNGRDIILTIRRDMQNIAETYLQKGIKRYGAAAGEVVVLEPSTGNILALASWPTYEQSKYREYDDKLFRNPSLSNLYEPGSTFKVLTVSAGIEEKLISPETVCTQCDGPRKIDKYTIRTWNDQYNPGISMRDALAKSDNIAMIFIAEKLGEKRLVEYIKKFGIGEKINIDLQGDSPTLFPNRIGPVELATISFGQGISTTSLQLIRAIGAIANQGKMMRPNIISKVVEHSPEKEIKTKPVFERQVVSAETARQVTEMMVYAAHSGEAQRLLNRNYTIAGKTGTSQIPSEGGGYEEDKTIASFIGFLPPSNPRFVMLVKLTEPSSSPWAAETAAPLWYEIAERYCLLLNIPPDKAPVLPTSPEKTAL